MSCDLNLSERTAWGWETLESAQASSPFPHMEAGVLRLTDTTVAILGGFATFHRVNTGPAVVWDAGARRWVTHGRAPPTDLGRTHAGTAVDRTRRVAYVVSGQPGPRCGPATAAAWCLHSDDGRWASIAPLPEARYGGTMQYAPGEDALHYVGGNLPDRVTVSDQHLIYDVRADRWRPGAPIPLGGDHVSSVGWDGAMLVVGGEHGHAAMRNDARYVPGTYTAHPYTFRLDYASGAWTRLTDLPVAVHHAEQQTLLCSGQGGQGVLVLGGSTTGDRLVSCAQFYDVETNRWTVLPTKMPTGCKGSVAWCDPDWVYVTGGQEQRFATDTRSGAVVVRTMRLPRSRLAPPLASFPS